MSRCGYIPGCEAIPFAGRMRVTMLLASSKQASDADILPPHPQRRQSCHIRALHRPVGFGNRSPDTETAFYYPMIKLVRSQVRLGILTVILSAWAVPSYAFIDSCSTG